MSDKGQSTKTDRRKVLEDEKSRIIVMRDFHQMPPEVGIYDGEVRYFKANKEWCKFIFGWLTWMQDPSFWTEAQDTTFHAIQQIMIFEEGIAPVLTSEDICEAIVCAADKIAKRLISGTTTGFAIDENGNVVVGDADGVEDIPDDPITPENEALEARSGEAISMANGYNSVIQRMLELFGSGSAAETPLEQAQFIMKSVYVSDDALMDAAVSHYYAYKTGNFESFTVLNADDLAEQFYCSDLSISVVLDYVFRLPEEFEELQIIAELWGAINSEQVTIWIKQGQEVPSTAYIEYGCVPVSDEEWDFIYSATAFPQRTTNAVHKHRHRLLIEASGFVTDPDFAGQKRDLLYHVSAAGVPTFENFQMLNSGLVASDFATQAKVPYSATNTYRWTVDLTDNEFEDGAIIFGRNVAPFNTPNIAGNIHIKVTDLGTW